MDDEPLLTYHLRWALAWVAMTAVGAVGVMVMREDKPWTSLLLAFVTLAAATRGMWHCLSELRDIDARRRSR